MQKILIAILLATGASRASADIQSTQPNLTLLPVPTSVVLGTGVLVMMPQLTVVELGFHDARLDAAVSRAIEAMRQRTGIALLNPGDASNAKVARLTIRVRGAGEHVQTTGEDESYELTVTSDGIDIRAETVVGALHALETMVQLVHASGDAYVLPLLSIKDSPRFPWRGLMVDCGRHFEPVDELKRTLDGMAAVKMNVFHWHLTEDQGFRIESKRFPKLTEMGSDGLFYTQDEAREIVHYAWMRGIRVVPEFEMPGHSTAWLVAYPELASGRAAQGIRREFGISDVALDPTREQTYSFIASFLAEMATIFPDPYVHIGGDETQSPEWKTDARILEFMKAHDLQNPDALQAYFNARVLKILTGLHKHMVGWDEILNPALPRDVVIQSWRGEESLVKGAQAGFQGVLSAGYYLDGMKPAEDYYAVDPLPSDARLTSDQRRLVLGGEACMFSEQIDERSIDSRLWPRTAAIAERFWSPEHVVDVDDMYRRLEFVSIELEGLRLHHLTQQDASLREMTGTQDIDSLRAFASVLEPVSFSERYSQQKTSQLTVLDRFVDAVRPDPPSRHEIARLSRQFLVSPGTDDADAKQLTGWFRHLSESVPDVERLIERSPLLAEVKDRAEQAPRLAQIGLDCVSYLSSATQAPTGWKARSLAAIEQAKKPAAIVRFTFLDPLTALVSAVRE